MTSEAFSRRDFLKLSALGLGTLAFNGDKNFFGKGEYAPAGYSVITEVKKHDELEEKYKYEKAELAMAYPAVNSDNLQRVTTIKSAKTDKLWVGNFSDYEILDGENIARVYDFMKRLALEGYEFRLNEDVVARIFGSEIPDELLIGIVNQYNSSGEQHCQTQSWKYGYPMTANIRIPSIDNLPNSISSSRGKIAISMLVTELAQLTSFATARKTSSDGSVVNVSNFSSMAQEVYANTMGMTFLMRSEGRSWENYQERMSRILLTGPDGMQVSPITLEKVLYEQVPILPTMIKSL